jgi:serine/threonine protein kinase
MAPEILEGKPYGIQAEIYSLGVILYWTLFGNAPYLYKNRMNPDDNELAG